MPPQKRGRINIYVPIDLKSAMQKRPDINWSQIAQEAFRRRLDSDGVVTEYGPFILSEKTS
jgi:hypothetical protein